MKSRDRFIFMLEKKAKTGGRNVTLKLWWAVKKVKLQEGAQHVPLEETEASIITNPHTSHEVV